MVKAVRSFRDLLALDDFVLTLVSDLFAFLTLVAFPIAVVDEERPPRGVEDVDEEDIDKLENEDELIELSKPLDVDDDVDEAEIFSNDVDELFELPRVRIGWCICLYVSLLTLASVRKEEYENINN